MPDIPDKLKYTKKEKLFELLSVAFALLSLAGLIVMSVLGYSKDLFIYFVIAPVVFGAFSIASVYPQWTNLVSDKEGYNGEEYYRKIRRNAIIAKLVILAAIDLSAAVMPLI